MELLVSERVICDLVILVMEQLCKSGVSPLADAAQKKCNAQPAEGWMSAVSRKKKHQFANGKRLVLQVALVGDSHSALIANTRTNRPPVS